VVKGYLTKKRNHWYVVVTDRDPVTNKRTTRWIATGETDDEKAQAFYHRVMHELNEGIYNLDASTATLQDVLKSWLDTKKASVDPKTLSWYTDMINNHLVPDLGNIKLKDLTSSYLTEYYQRKLCAGSIRVKKGKGEDKSKKTGGEMAPVSVSYLHNVLSMALGSAIDKGLIRTNPARNATPPKVPEAEIKYWLPEESRTFLAVAEQIKSPWYLYYATALGTGMRPNEVAALKWRDIDFKAGAITVQRSLRQPRKGLDTREKAPKTKNGRRRIDIPPKLTSMLAEHRKAQAAESAKVPDYVNRGLVFARADGDYINVENIRRRDFQNVIKAAGVPHITLVGLRHTHATELLMRGVPALVVSERLGHHSVAFTQKVYGHVIPGIQKQAAELIDDLYTQTTPNQSKEIS
jgi:integrase